MPTNFEKLSGKETESVAIIPSFNYPGLGVAVAELLGAEACPTSQRIFPNGETYFRSEANLRGRKVFIIASHVPDVIDTSGAILHSVLMVDAAKHASAKEVTLVAPFLGYQRQDRKALGRESVGARVMRHLIESSGTDRLITVDAHSPAVQSGYDIVFDHLTAFGDLEHAVLASLNGQAEGLVVVSPDGGAVKNSLTRAENMKAGFVEISKRRDRITGELTRTKSISGVEGAVCCIFDDIIDTAGTIVTAAETLKNSGAERVIVAATHGIFSAPALKRLGGDQIDAVFTTDTFPTERAQGELGEKLRVVSIAPRLAATIVAILRKQSVSEIFDQQNYR